MTTLRRLGRTDLEVTPIGLGCWQFSSGKGFAGSFWEALPTALSDDIVAASLRAGVRWFDTAEVYGQGRSEEALAHALDAAGKAGSEVLVATKWWPLLRTAGNLRATIDERLARLGGHGIDLYQVHQPFALATVHAQMDAMADLVAAKKVRAVGVSNFSAARMRAAHAALAARGLPLASNQVRFSLLDRRIERNGVLAAARDLGVSIIAYSPLAQGLLTGRFHDDPGSIQGRPGPRRWMPGFRAAGLEKSRPVVVALREVAAAHGAKPSQVALAWVLQVHGDAVVAIPGASRVAQAEDNAGAMAIELTRDEIDRLERASRPFR